MALLAIFGAFEIGETISAALWLLSVEVFICRDNISDDRDDLAFRPKLYMYNAADFVSSRHAQARAVRVQSETPNITAIDDDQALLA
ncbi:hypothetical protein [Pararhizobium sp.]|uniref:hypothetical protein n=1 Tax=Pararhizobium sp. TaxID=1977563 RepID=UPI003D12A5FE